jgi:REP element-mobilizing transposase RayT
MARLPRKLKVLPNHSVHKVWRGHNREWNLGSDYEKATYLEFLNQDLESKKYDHGAFIQALTLMSNHTHEVFLLITPELFSNHMRRHHSRYGAFFNRLKSRCGKVAQDRPHTTLLSDDHHEMLTVFYIHANPIRAGIVKDARNYYWSTHRLYAFGKREPWMRNIVLPDWYKKLGRTMAQRQREYRRLFARYLSEQGNTKKNFLKKMFFGPIPWMLQLETAVSNWRREHAPPS